MTQDTTMLEELKLLNVNLPIRGGVKEQGKSVESILANVNMATLSLGIPATVSNAFMTSNSNYNNRMSTAGNDVSIDGGLTILGENKIIPLAEAYNIYRENPYAHKVISDITEECTRNGYSFTFHDDEIESQKDDFLEYLEELHLPRLVSEFFTTYLIYGFADIRLSLEEVRDYSETPYNLERFDKDQVALTVDRCEFFLPQFFDKSTGQDGFMKDEFMQVKYFTKTYPDGNVSGQNEYEVHRDWVGWLFFDDVSFSYMKMRETMESTGLIKQLYRVLYSLWLVDNALDNYSYKSSLMFLKVNNLNQYSVNADVEKVALRYKESFKNAHGAKGTVVLGGDDDVITASYDYKGLLEYQQKLMFTLCQLSNASYGKFFGDSVGKGNSTGANDQENHYLKMESYNKKISRPLKKVLKMVAKIYFGREVDFDFKLESPRQANVVESTRNRQMAIQTLNMIHDALPEGVNSDVVKSMLCQDGLFPEDTVNAIADLYEDQRAKTMKFKEEEALGGNDSNNIGVARNNRTAGQSSIAGTNKGANIKSKEDKQKVEKGISNEKD